MAIDAFIRFTSPGNGAIEIAGESQDRTLYGGPISGDKGGWSGVQNVTFGSENLGNVATNTGGSGAGKLQFKEFSVKKLVDRSSPAFFIALCTGGHYGKVELFCRKNTGGGAGDDGGNSNVVFLKYIFTQVKVLNIDVSLSESDVAPGEDVKFSYAAMQISYSPQLQTGKLDKEIVQQWSQTKNAATTQA